MGHKCEYIGTLTLHGEEIVHEVTAVWKNKKELVYEEHEDGLNYCRYIYHSSICGYVVVFPNEKLNYYYGYNVQQEEDLCDCNRLGLYIYWKTKDEDLKKIAKARPELKYLIKKFDGTATQFIDLVNKYKINPSIESLVDLKLNKVALDKRLEKLSKSKRNEVINFIKNNKADSDISLSTILFCLKYKVSLNEAKEYAQYHYNYKLGNYLINNRINKYEYHDYIYMCKELNKNLKDDYWLYPKDFNERHDLVMHQLNLLREAERIAREKKAAKELVAKKNKVKEVARTLSKNNKVINGYYIYIPESIEDIINQAKELHQCLITSNYPEKVAKKRSVLVFIKKYDQPIATAEINYDKKLLQFYGDETDRNNCKPNNEVTNIFNQWLLSADIYKRSKLNTHEANI